MIAVDDFSLELRRGETAALIGPNGSGKTTALRLISGAEPADAGAIVVDGVEVTLRADRASGSGSGSPGRCRRRAAFRELTALEDVLVGRAVRRRYGGLVRSALATPNARREQEASETAALEALALVGLAGGRGRADSRADDLAAAPGRARRRAGDRAPGAARGRARRRRGAGGARRLVADVIDRIRERGVAVLVVEHNMRLVRRVADRVLVLGAGTVLAEGSAAEVAASGVVQQAYLGTAASVGSRPCGDSRSCSPVSRCSPRAAARARRATRPASS